MLGMSDEQPTTQPVQPEQPADAFAEMDREALKAFIHEHKLSVDLRMSTDKLRDAVRALTEAGKDAPEGQVEPVPAADPPVEPAAHPATAPLPDTQPPPPPDSIEAEIATAEPLLQEHFRQILGSDPNEVPDEFRVEACALLRAEALGVEGRMGLPRLAAALRDMADRVERAGARAAEPPPASPAAEVEWYRVERLSRYVVGGMVHTLAAGSEVSTQTHRLEELRAQGVPLVRIDGPSKPGASVGHRVV